jgi:enterochelin esterase-like enzyme
MRPRRGPPFARAPDARTWTVRLGRPPADRMEYRLEIKEHSSRIQVMCDPANPLRTPGPFGDKSVVQWPEYRPPRWLDCDAGDRGSSRRIAISSRALAATFDVVIWGTSGDSGSTPQPLLVAHDGPEYDSYSCLTHFLAWAVDEGRLPPLRAALLPPIDRNNTYSASGVYAYALANEILPALATVAPTLPGQNGRIGMGVSLGALAMMHAHRSYPDSFDALFLQSGSFFAPHLDPQESRFPRWDRITRFVERLIDDSRPIRQIPIAMTCGAAEENLANNRLTAKALHAQGYDCSLHEHRDAHNWVSWRDSFDPPLVDLAARVWGCRSGEKDG